MRALLKFKFQNHLILPIHYNNYLQALLYSNIENVNQRQQLHDTGYLVGAKKIKLFSFSKLFGKYEIKDKQIIFSSPVSFIFSFYDDNIISEIMYNFLKNTNYLNGTKIEIIDMIPLFFDENKYRNINHFIIEMLSPMVSYITKDNKKIFIDPWDPKFESAIKNNILTKLKAVGKESKEIEFSIFPNNRKNSRDEKVVYFKDTLIKGYNGIYTVKSTPEIMRLIYYAGIGSKNPEGFGCFKILGDNIYDQFH